MCGFLFTSDNKISDSSFGSALALMNHRGPDVKGKRAQFEKFRLGHNRLKILDLDDRSNQPFWSRDGRYVMIYNGEIYNFKEIAKKYKIEQKTTSDTEIILELYAKLGSDFLKELNGMFALVILDTLSKKIFVARDRLGIKPLYFSIENGEYLFSSEIAPLVDLINNSDIDPMGIRQYRKLRTFFNGRTIYNSIKMFPAGHFMEKDQIKKYWELPLTAKPPPTDEELSFLIKDSINYRCLSDVPVGSYLSGGLDSTIVAGLATKPHTWTVGFENHNEFSWANIAAEKFESQHHEVLIDKDEFVEIAKWMIKKRKEPLSVPNEVLLYKMTKEVKNENTVVLSGEGADELFFGYDRIFRWAAEGKWDLENFDRLYSYGSHQDNEIIDDALTPFKNYKSSIEKVAAFFQVSHLHGLLRRVDNSTMLCSVEARVPFVDHRLVERLAGVSFEFRMENGTVKKPLKRVFKDLLPSEIIERKKVGFPVPLSEIIFDTKSSNTPMDNWLDFNLSHLDIDQEILQEN